MYFSKYGHELVPVALLLRVNIVLSQFNNYFTGNPECHLEPNTIFEGYQASVNSLKNRRTLFLYDIAVEQRCLRLHKLFYNSYPLDRHVRNDVEFKLRSIFNSM